MTAALFLAYVALVASAVMAGAVRYLPPRPRRAVLIGLPAWLGYVGVVAWSGILRDTGLRPPGIALILAPAVLFIALSLVRGSLGGLLVTAVALPLLIGFQAYRVGVELLLYRLWQDGLAPRMLTFEGANADILVGLSAPFAAWLVVRGWHRTALAWNVAALLALANVVVRSALTAPGPLNLIHAEVPNLVVSTFPFVFLPGFLAPLAVALHVLAIRSLRARARLAPETHPAAEMPRPGDAMPSRSDTEPLRQPA